MFGADGIRWIKGVNRPGGGWAYMEHDYEFNLHWPDRYVRNPFNMNPGDIVVLHQNPHIPGLQRTFLTHLVTPVDSLVREDTERPGFRWYRKVAIIAKAPLEQLIDTQFLLYHRISLVNYGFGDAREILGLGNPYREDIQRLIWNQFGDFISTENIIEITKLFGAVEPGDDELGNTSGATEGALKEALRKHKYYERDRSIIRDKKNAVLSATGRLDCECCNRNFEEYYGTIGEGFIECHHIFPIGSGVERVTKLSDLALVCANCHRMLHRRKDDGTYHDVYSLKKEIELYNP